MYHVLVSRRNKAEDKELKFSLLSWDMSISITKENTYQIVFVSLMYFSFSYLPIRLFGRAHPFMSGKLVDRRERNIF